MAVLKSQGEEFYLIIFRELFSDLCDKYPSERKDLLRDLETVMSRCREEGLSFVTKTLPKLGKAFDESLGGLVFKCPREFKRSHVDIRIPAFLQGILKTVLRPDGSLDVTRSDVVKDVRQVLFLAYKLELPYTSSQERVVIDRFVENEQRVSGEQLSSHDPVIRNARALVHDVLSDFDPKDIVPRHGPGAVATGERLEGKWLFKRLYPKLHSQYPYYEYFVVGGARELLDRIEWYKSLDRTSPDQAKVVLVPKDSRGPRLISAEPLEFQYIQQGIGRKLMSHLESHRLTKGFINFVDQSVNGRLALEASASGEFATLDLKDASDLVSLTLVRLIFPERVYKCLEATRTSSTRLPDGRSVALHKFAPMGSALCFPVEALCFWAVAVAGLLSEDSRAYSDVTRSVYVYGDDIICRTASFHTVVHALESVGLEVNHSKSMHRGYFRESCGVDAFNGMDVTPTRIRTLWSGSPSDPAALVSYVSYANSFASKGYKRLSAYLFEKVKQVYGPIPYGTATSAYPCRQIHSKFGALIKNLEEGFPIRYYAPCQTVRVRAKSLVARNFKSDLNEWPRLLRDMVSPKVDDPDRVTVPRSVRIKARWMDI